MKRTITIFLVLLFSGQLYGRVFNVNLEQVYINIFIGTTLELANNYYNKNYVADLTAEEISGTISQDVPFFDRWAIRAYDKNMDDAGTYLTLFSLVTTAFFSCWDEPYTWDNFLVLSEILIAQSAINSWTKSLTLRKRPFVYDDQTDMYMKLDYNARFSFYSNHTSTAFAIAVYNHFHQYHTDRNPYLISMNYGIAALTGLSRISAGKHFLSDVVVGAIIGSISSYLICQSHRRGMDRTVIWGSDSVKLRVTF